MFLLGKLLGFRIAFAFSNTFWFVFARSTKVVFILSILLNPFSWNAFKRVILFFVSVRLSSPYTNFDLMIASYIVSLNSVGQ